jgi:hypothetical protein
MDVVPQWLKDVHREERPGIWNLVGWCYMACLGRRRASHSWMLFGTDPAGLVAVWGNTPNQGRATFGSWIHLRAQRIAWIQKLLWTWKTIQPQVNGNLSFCSHYCKWKCNWSDLADGEREAWALCPSVWPRWDVRSWLASLISWLAQPRNWMQKYKSVSEPRTKRMINRLISFFTFFTNFFFTFSSVKLYLGEWIFY